MHLPALLGELLQIQDPAERARFIEDQCAHDEQLKQQLASLVAAVPPSATNPLAAADKRPQATAEVTQARDDALNDDSHPSIGPYKLIQRLGEGGMGIVYMAEQRAPIRRTVALKIIKFGLNNKQVIARFETERQALTMMNHPNIARALDAGTTPEGLPYFVMDLVRGSAITTYCNTHQLSRRDRLELMVTVCEAIQHAHQKGVIHRDIKPSNVLVELHDVKHVPKIIDFGVAKATGERLTDLTLVTHFAQMLGTPLYMSPEQAGLNGLDVDTRSDIYSLGILLYELLTGSTPYARDSFRGVSFDEMRRMVRDFDPLRPSQRISTLNGEQLSTLADHQGVDVRQLRQDVDRELDWIVMKTLEKDRTRRYQTATELAADIQRYLNGEAVKACPPTLFYRWSKLAQRNKPLWISAAAIAATLLLATIVSSLEAYRATRAEAIADTRLKNESRALRSEVAARDAAEKSKETARRSADVAYRHQYQAEMQLGLMDLEAGNLSRLQPMLAGHLPQPDRQDLRGWEWYYMLSRAHESYSLGQHYSLISSLAWSPDGQFLATTSSDGDAIVWQAKTGERVRRFSYGGTFKRGIAWSHDSQRLAWGSVGDENAVRVWNRQNDEVEILRGHTYSLNSCAWHPDGRRLATTSMDGTTRIWDADAGETLHVLDVGDGNHVRASCWIEHGSKLVTVTQNGLYVWDVASGELLAEKFKTFNLKSVSSDPTATQLLIGKDNGDCWLIDTQSWHIQQTIKAHPASLVALHSPDGLSFATGSTDGTVLVWDAADGRQQYALQGHRGSVTSLAWSPDSQQLAAACSDGRIHLWPVPPRSHPIKLAPLSKAIESIQWKPSNDTLAVRDSSGRRSVVNAKQAAAVDMMTSPQIHEIASPNGKWLASVRPLSDKRLFQISVQDTHGEMIWETQFERLYRNGRPDLIWDEGGRRLVVLERHHLEVWGIPEGKQLFRWEGPAIQTLAWAQDGNRLAMAGGGDWGDNEHLQHSGFVHVFDIDNKRRLQKVRLGKEREEVRVVAWEPSGDAFSAGNGLGLVGAWDASSGEMLSLVQLHVAAVKSMDWNPRDGRIASVSSDGTLKIWDPATSREIVTLLAQAEPVTSVKWSTNGQQLATGSASGELIIWDATKGYAATTSSEHHRALAGMHATSAQLALDGEDLPEALHELSRAIELVPNQAAYRRSRGLLYARQGELQRGLVDLNVAAELDPHDTFVLSSRVDLLAELKRWQAALTDAIQLVELTQAARHRTRLALIYLMLDQREDYRRVCAQASQVNKFSDDYLWTCALAPDSGVDWEPIIDWARRMPAHDLGPQSQLARAAAFYRVGAVEQAIELLTLADKGWAQTGSTFLPGHPEDLLPAYAWYFLAMAQHDNGQPAEARRWLQKAEDYASWRTAQGRQPSAKAFAWSHHVVLDVLGREARAKLDEPQPRQVKQPAEVLE